VKGPLDEIYGMVKLDYKIVNALTI
jgi:hypothetical protein